jgi:hypothetical protein
MRGRRGSDKVTRMWNGFNTSNTNMVLGVTGALIRHSYYLVGALVLGYIGITMLPAAKPKVKPPADEKPSFHLADRDLAHLRRTGFVYTFQPTGRIEAWQYGQLTDRATDLTIALIMLPPNAMPAGDINGELARLRTLKILHGVGPWGNEKFHNLHTRFGELRAVEMRADVDGQRKQCLGFVSRFDSYAARMSGWWCTANGAKPSAIELACMLDQFTVDAKIDSADADAFLRARAAQPPSCSAEPVTQTTDTRTYVPRTSLR